MGGKFPSTRPASLHVFQVFMLDFLLITWITCSVHQKLRDGFLAEGRVGKLPTPALTNALTLSNLQQANIEI